MPSPSQKTQAQGLDVSVYVLRDPYADWTTARNSRAKAKRTNPGTTTKSSKLSDPYGSVRSPAGPRRGRRRLSSQQKRGSSQRRRLLMTGAAVRPTLMCPPVRTPLVRRQYTPVAFPGATPAGCVKCAGQGWTRLGRHEEPYHRRTAALMNRYIKGKIHGVRVTKSVLRYHGL